jgi:hypothetical protein
MTLSGRNPTIIMLMRRLYWVNYKYNDFVFILLFLTMKVWDVELVCGMEEHGLN